MSEPFGKDVGREVLPPYKEPGQIAHEAYYAYSPEPWADVPEHLREAWVRVEAAIYEDAAKIAEGPEYKPYGPESPLIWRGNEDANWSAHGESGYSKGRLAAAAAIRARD